MLVVLLSMLVFGVVACGCVGDAGVGVVDVGVWWWYVVFGVGVGGGVCASIIPGMHCA